LGRTSKIRQPTKLKGADEANEQQLSKQK